MWWKQGNSRDTYDAGRLKEVRPWIAGSQVLGIPGPDGDDPDAVHLVFDTGTSAVISGKELREIAAFIAAKPDGFTIHHVRPDKG